jgi:predicted RNA-binding protein
MCESTAYLREHGFERVVMREVAVVRPERERLVLTSVLGDRLEIDAVVTELDLMGHRILLEPRGAAPAG